MRTNAELSLPESNEKHFKLIEKRRGEEAAPDDKDKDDDKQQNDMILREYDGFSLDENTLQVKMSNRLSMSAFAKASHRLRSMALVSGHVL